MTEIRKTKKIIEKISNQPKNNLCKISFVEQALSYDFSEQPIQKLNYSSYTNKKATLFMEKQNFSLLNRPKQKKD